MTNRREEVHVVDCLSKSKPSTNWGVWELPHKGDCVSSIILEFKVRLYGRFLFVDTYEGSDLEINSFNNSYARELLPVESNTTRIVLWNEGYAIQFHLIHLRNNVN